MTEISFSFVWRKSDLSIVCDVQEFWRGLDMLGSEEIEQRASEICSVARSAGKVVAVSTAATFDYPRLRARFAYYRTAIAAEFRQQRLAARLCVYSRDKLTEWSRENPEEKLKGLFIILQAEEFRGRQHVPVYTQLGLNLSLVGYTPSGYQMRVEWFPNATVE